MASSLASRSSTGRNGLRHAAGNFRVLHVGAAVAVVLAQGDGFVQVHLQVPRDGQVEVLAADVDVFHEQQVVALGDHGRGPRVADVHDQSPGLAIVVAAVLAA